MKQIESPKHEFILIDTLDNKEQCIRKYILERTVGSEPVKPNPECANSADPPPTPFNRAKKFATDFASTISWQSPQLPSTETCSSLSTQLELESLSIIDKSTVSLTQMASVISDKTDKTDPFSADDLFLGEIHAKKERYKSAYEAGTIKPKNLKLFQLVVLANIVNELYPRYSLLKEQCYFFAGVIIFTVEEKFGVLPGSSCLDTTDQNKSGRWKGFKVQVVDKGVIGKLIAKYNEDYPKKVNMVCTYLLSNSHLLKHSTQIKISAKALGDQKILSNMKDMWSAGQWLDVVFPFFFLYFLHLYHVVVSLPSLPYYY